MRWILAMTIACFSTFSFGQDSNNEPLPPTDEILKLSKELQDLEDDILAVKKRLIANRSKASRNDKASRIWRKLVAKDEGRLKEFESQRREANRRLDAVNEAANAERKRVKSLPPASKTKLPPYEPFVEAFRRDRIDGKDAFRKGSDYFKVGEFFSLQPFGTKVSAAKNRKMLNEGHDPRYVHDLDNLWIVQVLDDERMLATFHPKLRSPVFLMQGVDTSEIQENNLHTWWIDGVFKVTGTYRYETQRGTMNTVFVLEAVKKKAK